MAKNPALNQGGALKALKGPAPGSMISKAPRLKPSSTREYGKGGTPFSQNLMSNVSTTPNPSFGGTKTP